MNEFQTYSTETTPPPNTPRRLCKSRRQRMIDGICGGIAEYFDLDPTIVRILWVLITLAGGSGFFLYIAAMIIMPVNPEHTGTYPYEKMSRTNFDHKRFWGILLILLGAFILISNLGIFAAFSWWSLGWRVMFPVVIILTGAAFIAIEMKNRRTSPPSSADYTQSTLTKKELRRSIMDRKLFGVCGGIARYFDIDSTVVRILYVVIIFTTFGWGLLLYIILAFLMPEEKPTIIS